MKKILFEYSKIIAYTVTGFIFGLAAFLFILNAYHFKEVNHTYQKTDSDYNTSDSLKEKISLTKVNLKKYNANNYKGKEDILSLNSIYSRLNICMDRIDNKEFNKLLSKKNISINDVYSLEQFYKNNISNECLVKEIYDFSNSENDSIKISTLDNIKPFINDNIDYLIKSNDYIEKNIKNNSSYYFSSRASQINLYDSTRDSYYTVINNYKDAINFIYDISIWFRNTVGG